MLVLCSTRASPRKSITQHAWMCKSLESKLRRRRKKSNLILSLYLWLIIIWKQHQMDPQMIEKAIVYHHNLRVEIQDITYKAQALKDSHLRRLSNGSSNAIPVRSTHSMGRRKNVICLNVSKSKAQRLQLVLKLLANIFLAFLDMLFAKNIPKNTSLPIHGSNILLRWAQLKRIIEWKFSVKAYTLVCWMLSKVSVYNRNAFIAALATDNSTAGCLTSRIHEINIRF